MLKTDIAVTGIGAVFPEGEYGDLYGSVNRNDHQYDGRITRKLQRYMSPSTPVAVLATEIAFDDARLRPESESRPIGLYASQSGYLNPHLTDFIDAFKLATPESTAEAFKEAWHSPAVSPFILTNILNNNILGMLSLHWNIAGDSGAFIRDEPGETCALSDALYSLREGVCDVAVVVAAGAESDLFEGDLTNGTGEALSDRILEESGAVALVLEREDDARRGNKQIHCCIDLLSAGYSAKHLFSKVQSEISNGNRFDALVSDLKASSAGVDQLMPATIDAPHTKLSVIQGLRGCPGILTTIVATIKQQTDTLANKESDDRNNASMSLAVCSDAYDHLAAVVVRKN